MPEARAYLTAAMPLLRWAGSKKRQYGSMSRQFPVCYERYVEPFAGSAAFLFKIARSGSLLSDLNTDVVDLYKYVAADGDSIFNMLCAMPRDPDTYYGIREQMKVLPRSLQRSTSFYYLNRNCFNGIYRVNRKGEFNVPFSDKRVSPYLTKQQFEESSNFLRTICTFNQDFELFINEQVRKGDFVYLDPPYYSEGQRIFNEYQVSPFCAQDLDRLESCLRTIHRRQAYFMLTFPGGDKISEVASSWRSLQISTLRSIAGKAQSRRRHTEIMVFNYER